MKRIIQLGLLSFLLVIAFSDCGKGSGGEEKPVEQEANLVVGLNPEPSTGINQALSTSYTFNVLVQSTMPSQGVEIKVSYVKDSDGASIFSQTLTSSLASAQITINNIPFNQIGTVTVVVTSKTKATNTVTKSFKLIKK